MFDTKFNQVIESVRRSALLSLTVQNASGREKDDKSPVTVADYAVQATVTSCLRELDPNTPLVAEEEAQHLSQDEELCQEVLSVAQRELPNLTKTELQSLIGYSSHKTTQKFWTLDPIDGTKGFLRGANYAIALGLVEDNIVISGVLACPKLKVQGHEGVLLAAQRDGGCWIQDLDGKTEWAKVQVSSVDKPKNARILHSYEATHTNLPEITALREHLGIEVDGIGLDSQAKYALLAAGEGELIFRLPHPKKPNYKEKIWDHAAGLMCLHEAGGKITDMNGTDLDLSQGYSFLKNTGILASNGKLHSVAVSGLQAIHSQAAAH